MTEMTGASELAAIGRAEVLTTAGTEVATGTSEVVSTIGAEVGTGISVLLSTIGTDEGTGTSELLSTMGVDVATGISVVVTGVSGPPGMIVTLDTAASLEVVTGVTMGGTEMTGTLVVEASLVTTGKEVVAMIVDLAGQSVTVAAHEMIVTSVVWKTVDSPGAAVVVTSGVVTTGVVTSGVVTTAYGVVLTSGAE